jgi:hypothetical protein
MKREIYLQKRKKELDKNIRKIETEIKYIDNELNHPFSCQLSDLVGKSTQEIIFLYLPKWCHKHQLFFKATKCLQCIPFARDKLSRDFTSWVTTGPIDYVKIAPKGWSEYFLVPDPINKCDYEVFNEWKNANKDMKNWCKDSSFGKEINERGIGMFRPWKVLPDENKIPLPIGTYLTCHKMRRSGKVIIFIGGGDIPLDPPLNSPWGKRMSRNSERYCSGI